MEGEALQSQEDVLPFMNGPSLSINATLPLQIVANVSEPAGSKSIFSIDSKKFVAVGCIRLQHTQVDERWACLGEWQDVSTIKGMFKDSAIITESRLLSCIESLLKHAWIRARFMSNKQTRIQAAIQVYVSPDDDCIYRPPLTSQMLRRALRNVMMHIDLSPELWKGDWKDHGDEAILRPSYVSGTSLSGEDVEQSLFYIFNTLPSPNPQPSEVRDIYSNAAMEAILASDIPGLKSELYQYQRRSAAMMVQREALSISTPDPRLVETKTQHFKYYYDPVRAFVFCKPQMFEQARGGICAETMGLG
jgi:hypothetical protein